MLCNLLGVDWRSVWDRLGFGYCRLRFGLGLVWVRYVGSHYVSGSPESGDHGVYFCGEPMDSEHNEIKLAYSS